MSSYSDLVDLVLAKGTTHSELLRKIHDVVVSLYQKLGYDLLPDMNVSVDEQTGEIRILYQGNDATPPGFAEKAQEATRLLMTDLLKQKSVILSQSQNQSLVYKRLSFWEFIFWGYNVFSIISIIVVFFTLITSLPTISLYAVVLDSWFFYLMILSLVVVPFCAVVLAVRKKRYTEVDAIEKILFEYEIPSLLLVFIGFSVVVSLAFIYQWFFTVFISLFIVGYVAKEELKNRTVLRLSVWSIFSAQFFYVLFICLLFVPVTIVKFIQVGYGYQSISVFPKVLIDCFSSGYLCRSTDILYSSLVFFIPLLIVVSILLAVLKSILHVVQQTKEAYKEAATVYGKYFTAGIAVVSICAFLVLTSIAVRIFPIGNVSLLVRFAQANTYEDQRMLAQKIFKNESAIRQNTKNISPPRYLFGNDPELLAESEYKSQPVRKMLVRVLNSIFSFAVRPFSGTSYTSYQTLLEDALGRVEYQTSQATSRSSLVQLSKRKIQVIPLEEEAFARMSIEDEFVNTTNTEQEIIEEFTLPSDAVVFDLALGTDLEYTGVVAPKGAASQTYQQQLAVRKDPALLEQIGPSSYRLRVFPIPRKDDPSVQEKKLRVRFSYIVAADKEGYPLPLYTQLTNLSTQSVRIEGTFRDQPISLAKDERVVRNSEFVFSSSPLCRENSPRISSVSQFRQQFTVVFHPQTAVFCQKNDISTFKKIAVFIDTSKNGVKNIGEYLDILDQLDIDADIYFYNNLVSKKYTVAEAKKISADSNNFGNASFEKLLAVLPKRYDGGIIVTGSTPSPYTSVPSALTQLPYPVTMMVDQGKIGQFSPAWIDALFAAGIVVETNFEKALSIQLTETDNDTIAVYPGFSVKQTQQKEYRDFVPSVVGYLGANASIAFAWTQQKTGYTTQTAFLDDVHARAKAAGIVSPSSSLIALVNDQQKALLSQLSTQDSRYQTQSDQVIVNIGRPGNMRITNPLSNFFTPAMTNTSFGRGELGYVSNSVSSPYSAGAGSTSLLTSLLFPFVLLISSILFILHVVKNMLKGKKKQK